MQPLLFRLQSGPLIFTKAEREARDAALPSVTGKDLKPTEGKRLIQGHTPSKE